MAKFVGNIVIGFVLVGATLVILRSLPDIARYLELREM
jgi:hypothetical protein